MSTVSSEQLSRILALAEALAGETFGERGEALAQIACERAMTFCNRTDIPQEMEQAVASLLCALEGAQSDVKSVTRGDTAVTYETSHSASYAPLRPFCKLGTVKDDR